MPTPPEGPRLRTAMLAIGDPRDPRLWSGTPLNMIRALERALGPVESFPPMPGWARIAPKIPGRLRARLTGAKDLPGHTGLAARLYGALGDRRLRGLRPAADLVFAPAGSTLIPHLQSRLPLVYSSDATIRTILGYYPQYSGIDPRAAAAADALERAAIARADLLLYPTRWAADSARTDYGADPAKICVLAYGANLDEVPPPDLTVPPRETLRLLFVGVNWAIKGGAIAVETLQALRARGVEATLDIVGCTPPEPVETPGLTVTPFLDKNRAEDRARLDAFYRAAHFLVLPTRCECYGIVFCEASAYGLPSIATRTGGVPEVVREGANGHTLPLAEGGGAWAALIAEIWADKPRYEALRRSARAEFDTRLNWDVWGRDAAAAVRDMLRARAA